MRRDSCHEKAKLRPRQQEQQPHAEGQQRHSLAPKDPRGGRGASQPTVGKAAASVGPTAPGEAESTAAPEQRTPPLPQGVPGCCRTQTAWWQPPADRPCLGKGRLLLTYQRLRCARSQRPS